MASARTNTVVVGELGRLYSLGSVGSLSDGQLLERYLAGDEPAVSEAAFSALVSRHGAMVLSICQRVLQDSNDAHDAFQATFLVLVRKAGSIRRRESVAGWLYGIARRVAARARLDAARRRRRLAELAEQEPIEAVDEEAPTDYAPLIAEIDQLPDRFRDPVVLHYFEGLSTEATAMRLGCPRGTVLSRLARARDRLRMRLERRGVSLEAILPASAAASRMFSSTAVPGAPRKRRSARRFLLPSRVRPSKTLSPSPSRHYRAESSATWMMARLRAASVLLLLGVTGAVIGLTAIAPAADKPQDNGAMKAPPTRSDSPAVKTPTFKPNEKPASGSPVVRGQVLDPDRNPVAGAQIMTWLPTGGRDEWQQSPKLIGTSGPDGRFEVSIPRQALRSPGEPRRRVRVSLLSSPRRHRVLGRPGSRST